MATPSVPAVPADSSKLDLASLPASVASLICDDADVTKPLRDEHAYRVVSFRNGLVAVLVSDPTTDKAAASLDVSVGQLSDPADIPGLAHFLEHMLFLGTRRFPGEDEYTSFLARHGGASNAFTALEHTNYHLEVSASHLAGALDRFSDFFKSPLFTESMTDRELRAVDSEHAKNEQDDRWRVYQLERHLSDPGHPYSQFGTGTAATLSTIPLSKGISVRQRLLDFYATHYTADRMRLCVLGTQPLDELERLVSSLFSDIPSAPTVVPHALPTGRVPVTPAAASTSLDTHPLTAAHMEHRILVVPIKDSRSVSVSFRLPSYFSRSLACKPTRYISHLVGHEGPGSLLSFLKRQGLANALGAGASDTAIGFDIFIVDIDLTEAGLDRVDDVIVYLMQYIALVRDHGPQEWVWNECRDLARIQFTYAEKKRPMSFVTSMSSNLQPGFNIPPAEILSAGSFFYKYEPELIARALDLLTVQNMRVIVSSQSFATIPNMVKEPWYGTDHLIEPFSAELLNRLVHLGPNPELSLPLPNQFIPSSFDLVEAVVEAERSPLPALIHSSPLSRMFYKRDDTFKVPKAELHFKFKSPVVNESPEYAVMSALLIHLVNDSLAEFSYDAELTGLTYHLQSTTHGVEIYLSGYQDKQPVLLSRILEKFAVLNIDVTRFADVKDRLLRSLRNYDLGMPYNNIDSYVKKIMVDKSWSVESLADALVDVSPSDVMALHALFLRRLFVDSLVVGNVSARQALRLLSLVENLLGSPRPLHAAHRLAPLSRTIALPGGSRFVWNKTLGGNDDNRNSAIHSLFVVGDWSRRSGTEADVAEGVGAVSLSDGDVPTTAAATAGNPVNDMTTPCFLRIALQLLSQRVFDQLRTREQLGYVAFTVSRRYHGVCGLAIILQSERHPYFLSERIAACLHEHVTRVIRHEMTDEQYREYVEAAVKLRLEKDKRLAAEAQRYWTEIGTGLLDFDVARHQADIMRTITKAEMAEFLDNLLINPSTRRQLTTCLISPLAAGSEDAKLAPPGHVIEDLDKFKATVGLMPGTVARHEHHIMSVL